MHVITASQNGLILELRSSKVILLRTGRSSKISILRGCDGTPIYAYLLPINKGHWFLIELNSAQNLNYQITIANCAVSQVQYDGKIIKLLQI